MFGFTKRFASLVFLAQATCLGYSQTLIEYTDTAHNYSFKYPSDWEISHSSKHNMILSAPGGDTLKIVPTIYVEIFESLDLSIDVRLDLKKMELNKSSTFSNVVITAISRSSNDRLQTIELEGSSEVAGSKVLWIVLLANFDMYYLELSGSIDYAHKEEYYLLLNSVIGSFRLN